MQRLARRFLFVALAITAVLAIGTVGFMLIEGYSFFQALYTALLTMTTVGYGDSLHRTGRIFNSFLLVVGVTTILVAIGAMTQTIIEVELGEFLGKRRNKRMIEKLENHFIICGYGRVGRGAASELQQAGVSFVVVDIDHDRVEKAIASGILAVAADSTRDETLRDVNIARAKGLVCALATDADNLFVLLSAKFLNPGIFVATRAAEEGAEEKMRRAGADAVFAPYAITGHRLAQALLRPHVVQFLDFATQAAGLNVVLEQVRVARHSDVVSKSIREMQIGRDFGVIVLAIHKGDGGMLFNPPADTLISAGDCLIVMGQQDRLHTLEATLGGARGE
ncbi:MAG TPA: potassium channel protein [Bryobacteraceae bacterium]|nr:potassium channel protein [Bryobacteraceae bacterium]